eukprot:TRINITY_DN1439_c0_g1_i1.p1 TRINITY_DN1439_c0_g1~~TRINITY_DN1439_c0_g1_i1.p1  ORF type:complete len:268 (+),score=36.68 TRINITY_DN1439_c0_g1_i1:276-1079(+)
MGLFGWGCLGPLQVRQFQARGQSSERFALTFLWAVTSFLTCGLVLLYHIIRKSHTTSSSSQTIIWVMVGLTAAAVVALYLTPGGAFMRPVVSARRLHGTDPQGSIKRTPTSSSLNRNDIMHTSQTGSTEPGFGRLEDNSPASYHEHQSARSSHAIEMSQFSSQRPVSVSSHVPQSLTPNANPAIASVYDHHGQEVESIPVKIVQRPTSNAPQSQGLNPLSGGNQLQNPTHASVSGETNARPVSPRRNPLLMGTPAQTPIVPDSGFGF